MNWTSAVFGIAVLFLFVRSTQLLRHPNVSAEQRCFGWVTLIVAALALLLHVLIAVGMLVISPEFGVAMIQGGDTARYGMHAVLLAIGVVGGLGWQVARMRAGRPDRYNQLLLVGIAIGLIAMWYTQEINPDDNEILRIYSYDLWWPPLQLWLVACLVAIGLAEPILPGKLSRVLAIDLAVAAATMPALLRLSFAGPSTADVWFFVALIALPSSWAVAGWIAVPWKLGGQNLWRTIVKVLVPSAGAMLGVVVLSSANILAQMNQVMLPLVVLIWPLVLCMCRPLWLRQLWSDRSRITFRTKGVFISIALVAAALAEIFYVADYAATLALTFFLFAWIAKLELLYPGALSRLIAHAISGEIFGKTSPLRAAAGKVPGALRDAWNNAATIGVAIVKAPSFPVALLKFVVGVLLLVALAEIPNAGKTIVLAPQTPTGQAYNGIGQAVADHVVNDLAVLNDDLLPDLIVLKDLRQGSRATSHGSTTLDSALAKSTDVRIGEVTIPLSAIVAPIQAPMRALLRVRVVSGSIHESSTGYTLLAESTLGESWRVDYSTEARHSDKRRGDVESKVAEPLAKNEQSRSIPADAVASLAEELAFRIRRDDPRLAGLGMTDSSEAFEAFRKGLRGWRRFELTSSYDELEGAIEEFRDSIRIDPSFALAHYRLALALQKDGQPAQAVEALRESLRVRPESMSAVAALATTLWDFDTFRFSPPAAFPESTTDSEVTNVRRSEARELWQRLVQSSTREIAPLDLAAANYGLCLEAFQTRNAALQTQWELVKVRRDMSLIVGRLADTGNAIAGWMETPVGESTRESGSIPRPSNKLDDIDAILKTTEEILDYVDNLNSRVGIDKANSHTKEIRGEIESAREQWTETKNSEESRAEQDIERKKQGYSATHSAIVRIHDSMEALVKGQLGLDLSRALEVYTTRGEHQARMTYFYCKRGEELYGRLPKGERTALAVRRAEGLVLNVLGTLLEDAGSAPVTVKGKLDWHCRQDDYSESNEQGVETSRPYRLGPHALVALKYYQRAGKLLPEDRVIRCNCARVARAMGNDEPMYVLSTSAEARSQLGDEFLVLGQSRRSEKFLEQALDEYREAIRRDPYHIASLNGFAYSAWQSQLFKSYEGNRADPEILQEAEGYARTAAALTANRFDPGFRARVRSTLGEILLGQNRSHEAAEELRSALKDLETTKTGVGHAAFHELRWDLAAAALCAALIDERTGFKTHAKQLRAEAGSLLIGLQKTERNREFGYFREMVEAPSSLRAPYFCGRQTGHKLDNFPYRLSGKKYSTAQELACDREWIRAAIVGDDKEWDSLQLHVWGDGVHLNAAFSHGKRTAEEAFTNRSLNSHHVYFAQLIRWGGEAVSEIYPVRTYATAGKSTCSENLVELTFDVNNSVARK